MKRRGSVLIIVLWSLFILGALAVAISGYVNAQLNLAQKLSSRAREYYLARAGVERAILEVKNDTTDTYDALTDSWGANDAVFKGAKLGDGTYSVFPLSGVVSDTKAAKYGLSDEESKININKAPKDILKNFFQIVGGVGEDDATAIAASIINWRSPADQPADKDGADAFHYQALGRPYKCKNAPIEVPEELLLVSGVTGGIFDKVKSRFTVYGGGAVNINTADEKVLSSLGMGDELAGKVVRFRGEAAKMTEENVFDDASKITALLAKKESISDEESGKVSGLIAKGLLSVTSDNFGGVAVGSMGNKNSGGSARIAFIFDRKNNVIKYWSE